jgi:multidrug efflux pump subunit AcrB
MTARCPATALILVVYVGLISLTYRLARLPVPERTSDLVTVTSQRLRLARTDAVVRDVNDIILSTPGIDHSSPNVGFDVTTSTVAPNAATIFFGLPSLYGKHIPGVNAASVLATMRKRLAVVKDAFVLVVNPPPVQGLGTAGGFKLMVEDRNNLGSQALANATKALVAAANKDPDFAGVFTLYNASSPSLYADIDRQKAEKVTDADGCLLHAAALLGSVVNDFNYLGRTFRSWPRAMKPSGRPRTVERLKVRNAGGDGAD